MCNIFQKDCFMQIICKHCEYNLNKIAIGVYLTAAIGKMIQEISPYLIQRNIKKDFSQTVDDTFVAIANALQIECPMCMKYEGWAFLKDNTNLSELNIILENTDSINIEDH